MLRRDPDKLHSETGEVSVKKVKILEDKEDEAGRQDADGEDTFAFTGGKTRYFQPDASNVIDDDRHGKDDDVFRNKHHVEDATGDQQHPPAMSMREHEIQQCYHRKEDEKFE